MTRTSIFSKELTFSLEICEQAKRVIMQHFNHGVQSVTKGDGSPVTEADKAAERLIREGIAKTFPLDGILGEEEGESFGSAGKAAQGAPKRKWIIDPIDGTFGFIRGLPIFSTLLALEQDGEIVLGVISAPAVGDMYWAEKGQGAFKNGKQIHVSDCADISKTQFNFGCLSRILDLGYWDGFTKIIKKTYRQRGPGDYLGFAEVIEGKAEAHIEVGVKPWDLAPMKILIKEAGGIYFDLNHGESIYTGSCLITNRALHEEFRTLLGSPRLVQ
jgi:histidinol-phosphatase